MEVFKATQAKKGKVEASIGSFNVPIRSHHLGAEVNEEKEEQVYLDDAVEENVLLQVGQLGDEEANVGKVRLYGNMSTEENAQVGRPVATELLYAPAHAHHLLIGVVVGAPNAASSLRRK